MEIALLCDFAHAFGMLEVWVVGRARLFEQGGAELMRRQVDGGQNQKVCMDVFWRYKIKNPLLIRSGGVGDSCESLRHHEMCAEEI